MNSSASPAADRTRRLFRRGPDTTSVPSLDPDEAAAVLKRSVTPVPEPVEPPADTDAGRHAREATERVIAHTVAAEPTHRRPAQPPQPGPPVPPVRPARLARPRRDLELVGDLVEHVPVVEEEPAPAARRTDLPDDVRRELERATRELTEAAHAARLAREAAEQAAAAHAEQTVRAETVAREQSASARNEAMRRRAAEELASESAQQVASAHAERVRVEVEAKRQFELAAKAAEAHAAAERAAEDSAARAAAACEAREQAEAAAAELGAKLARAERQATDLTAARTAAAAQLREQATEADAARAARAEAEAAALRATLEREVAEARALQLAATLEATRAQLLEQTRATLAAERARAAEATRAAATPAPVVAPEPAPARVVAPSVSPVSEKPEPRIWPAGAEQTVRFAAPSSSAVITVVLGVGALVAAGFAVYQAYLDRLTETPGIVAAVVTLALVVAVGRTRNATTSVWIEQGVLHVENDDWHRKFDLTTKDTLVQMVGQPGDRRWKVILLRKSQAAFELDASVVDPHEFVAVLRDWRPEL